MLRSRNPICEEGGRSSENSIPDPTSILHSLPQSLVATLTLCHNLRFAFKQTHLVLNSSLLFVN